MTSGGYPAGRPRRTAAERQRIAEERTASAAWVRQAREKLGEPAGEGRNGAATPARPISQQELANQVGCSRSLVEGWEAGERTLGSEHRAKVEALLAGE